MIERTPKRFSTDTTHGNDPLNDAPLSLRDRKKIKRREAVKITAKSFEGPVTNREKIIRDWHLNAGDRVRIDTRNKSSGLVYEGILISSTESGTKILEFHNPKDLEPFKNSRVVTINSLRIKTVKKVEQ